MTSWFVKLWEWLDGKKTKTGGVLLFISAVLRQVLLGFWGVDLWGFIHNIADTLDWFGLALGATGGIHRGVKNYAGVRNAGDGSGGGPNP